MCDLNLTTIVGRLVRDPEMRFGPSGVTVGTFCVAANHSFQDKAKQWRTEVAFVPAVAFGREAEGISACRKGASLFVSGRLRTDSWQKDGSSHSRLVLVVDKMVMLRDARPPEGLSPSQPEALSPLPEKGIASVPF